MTSLKDLNCTMTKAGTAGLTDARKEELLGQISNKWQMIEGNTQLYIEYKFKNFKSALELVNTIAQIAEEQKHHPDINFGWGYCNIRILTHTINNLVESDFILAAKIDEGHSALVD